RRSRIFRRAAGEDAREQLIVANVDTVFLTTSCTEEFNEARLERYLALAHAGGVPPVFVLTKADRSDEPDAYLARLPATGPKGPPVSLNAKATGAAAALMLKFSTGRNDDVLGKTGDSYS